MEESFQNIPKFHRHHCHDGIWYGNVVLDSSIEGLCTFTVRPDDVWILSYPKSGMHWLMEIVGLIMADGHPDKVDRSLYVSLAETINMAQKFPRSLEEETANPPDMTPFLQTIEKAPSPRVIVSHLRYDRMPKDLLKTAKVIYVARNPKDAVASWFNFAAGSHPLTPPKWEDSLQNFIEGRNHWGPWFEHVQEFWNVHHDENLLFLFYEDMLKDPAKSIEQIAAHIKRPLSEDAFQRVVELSSLDAMKATHGKLAADEANAALIQAPGQAKMQFLNQAVCGKWKKLFTVAQNEMFDKLYRDKMAGTDLTLIFE